MNSESKNMLSFVFVMLLAPGAGKSQTLTTYTKYANTFIGTTLFNNSAVHGYNLSLVSKAYVYI